MKILQIISRAHNRSGSGVQMMQLAIELDLRGHDVAVVYQYDSEHDCDFEAYKQSNVRIFRIPIKSETLKLSGLMDVFTIRRLIKKGDFDLIHSHSSAIDYVFLATIGMNIPIVANRGMSAKLNWIKGFKYRSDRVNKVIAVSQDIKNIMMKTGSIDSEKIDVIYGGVDPKRFDFLLKEKSTKLIGAVSRRDLSIPEGACVIGYTGSIGGRKGINYLLNAFKEIVKGRLDQEIYLLLVGISKKRLRKFCFDMQLEISENIVCVGFQYDPQHYMALFDLFIFPGVRDEGLTGAIREAVSMKIPVISTNNGGNNELIINKKTGLMVPVKRVDFLVEAISFAIKNKMDMIEMAESAHQLVMKKMTIKKRVDIVEALYKSLCRTDNLEIKPVTYKSSPSK